MKEDIPVLQQRGENGKVKATQLPKCQSWPFLSPLNFQSENCLLPSNKLFHNVYNGPQKKRENSVHKQGIKLPLYKNRSFSKCFFSFSFFLHLNIFTVYATKKAVIVSRAQLFLITLFEHTIAKQHIQFGGFNHFSPSLFWGPINCWGEAGSFKFRAAAILLVNQDSFL